MKWMLRVVTVLFVLCLGGLAALLYWPSAPSTDAAAAGPAAADGAPQSLGQFIPLAQPRPAPDVAFTSRTGEPVRLADFRGHVVLVNLWATWCAPCVHEMPSLDRLQAKLGKSLKVLAISQDRGGAAVVDPFLAKLDPKALVAYLDSKGAVAQAFGVRGLPTSILIDRDGRVLGRLEGAAEWDSAAMAALLEKYLGPAPAPVEKVSARP